MYSVCYRVCVCVCVCANVCVASQFPLFHKVYFYLFFKSNFTAGMSYLMWNRVPCSHASMLYLNYGAVGLVMFSSCAVIGSVFCHSWGHYLTAKSTGRARTFKILSCCHRFTLELTIQEGSWSLATAKMTSNHFISTVALIGLIMLTSYFQNLS